jgi:hypothetical protein
MSIRQFFIILILIVFSSCTNHPDFSGNFANCSHKGHYVELNIKNDSLRISSHKSSINRWTKFKISGDTLFGLTAGELIDSMKVIISFKNKDSFELHHFESNYRAEFYRINEKVNLNESDIEHKRGVVRRFKNAECYLYILEFEKKIDIQQKNLR